MRFLRAISTAISLVLFLVMALIWIRSYWVSETLLWSYPSHQTLIGTSYTQFFIRSISPPPSRMPGVPIGFLYCKERHPDFWGNYRGASILCVRHEWLGFAYGVYPSTTESYRFWAVPYWSIQLVASILPLLFLYRWLRRRRFHVGCCQKCGYDLRAHKPGDKCPECSTIIETMSRPPEPPANISQ
jgi:hypothetical protein